MCSCAESSFTVAAWLGRCARFMPGPSHRSISAAAHARTHTHTRATHSKLNDRTEAAASCYRAIALSYCRGADRTSEKLCGWDGLGCGCGCGLGWAVQTGLAHQCRCLSSGRRVRARPARTRADAGSHRPTSPRVHARQAGSESSPLQPSPELIHQTTILVVPYRIGSFLARVLVQVRSEHGSGARPPSVRVLYVVTAGGD